MGNETENKSPSSKGPAVEVAEEKFQELAPTCRDRITSTSGSAICTYHESSPTDCRSPICPRSDLPLDMAANYLEKIEGRKR